MTAFDKKVNQIAARHRWNIEKQARAAVPCYIIAAPTYEDTGQIAAYRERERQKAALVDAFYMALKANGGDQNAAKAAQREKAVQWNAVEVFNEIYA